MNSIFIFFIFNLLDNIIPIIFGSLCLFSSIAALCVHFNRKSKYIINDKERSVLEWLLHIQIDIDNKRIKDTKNIIKTDNSINIKIHFDDFPNPYIYYWDAHSICPKWPGELMIDDENGGYNYEINNINYCNLIIHNNKNKNTKIIEINVYFNYIYIGKW